MNTKKTFAAIALPMIAASSMLPAAWGGNSQKEAANCAPEPAAPCNVDTCQPCYCLGPENVAINAPVRPRTCNGDVVLMISGFYWIAHQDGMEYAINDGVTTTSADDDGRTNLIDSKLENPDFDWDFGFKVGIGYNSACDGWDLSLLWTRYQGKASSHVETESDDNHTLLPIWSDFVAAQASDNPIYATDIETRWGLDLNLVDLELGRESWNSKRLSLRPFIGLRFASINQDYNIYHKGGTFTSEGPFNNEVDLDNHFKGVGLRTGLDSTWNFGCGWGLYGNFAVALLYGRFDIDQDEMNRQTGGTFSKSKVLETENHFRVSRMTLDLGLGVQYAALVCDCKYGLAVQFGWEQHLFMDQNQLWRIVKLNATDGNIYHQRRGNLDTAGWTLSFKFDF